MRAPILVGIALLLAGCPAPADFAVDLGDAYAIRDGSVFPGLVSVPNIDDDDRNGVADWYDGTGDSGVAAGSRDRGTFAIQAEVLRLVGKDESLELRYEGGWAWRVWLDGAVVLGLDPEDSDPDASEDELDERVTHRFEIPLAEKKADRERVLFRVETARPLEQARLLLVRVDADGESIETATVYLTASPMLLHHHTQQSEHTWALDVSAGFPGYHPSNNNEHMISTYQEVLGDDFTAIEPGPYDYDVWVQDELQLAYFLSPESRIDLVIDSIRDRGLDDFPEEGIVGSAVDGNGVPRTRINPDVVAQTWGTGFPSSLDSFGNLEVSPPTTVGGVEFPFGRTYYGGLPGTDQVTQELQDALVDQLVQKPFEPDTTWLCVGHIDEVTSVLPDPTAPKGWRFVMADTHSAWQVLEGLDPGLELPRYARAPGGSQYGGGHDIDDVGQWVNSNALRMLNEEIQEDHLDPMEELFRAELGLTDEDIVRMPSLFEEAPFCGGAVAALIPGMQNLIVANVGDESHVFLADPFVRDSDDPRVGQEDDAMIAHVRATMPSHLQFHFVDNWAVYHMALGEVHCGTNMVRTPAQNWWETAGHLLEGSP